MKLLFGPNDGREFFVPAERDIVDTPVAEELELRGASEWETAEAAPTMRTARYVRKQIRAGGEVLDVFLYEKVLPISVAQVIKRLILGYRGADA